LFKRNVTFMTTDPGRLADLWAAVLGLTGRRDKRDETIVADAEWSDPRLTFQTVTELGGSKFLRL
jgi:Glyoxalase-like domain